MTKPYIAVVAASQGYEPGLSALLNSFRLHHKDMGIRILVGDCNLDPEFKEKHDGDDVEWIPIESDRGHIFTTKIHRFAIATEQKGAVVGLFDADMYIVRSMLNMWKMAEAGFIVGGSNGSNIRFGANWNESYGMEVPECWDTKTITSVPTFCDIDQHGEVWSEVYRHKVETNKGADFNLLNIMLCKLDKLDYVIPFTSSQMTGVHHQFLKCDTRIINKANELLTMNGLELFCVHGRFWEGNWYTNLTKNMPKYLARLGIHSSQSKAYQGVLQSQQLLKDEFDKYCNWPYKWSVKPATEANVQEQLDTFFVEPVKLEEQNQALVEKNMQLAERIESLQRQIKGYEHEIKVIRMPQEPKFGACGFDE